MDDLTYRRHEGFHLVGTGKSLPPGSFSSAAADFIPDTRQHTAEAAADAWNELNRFDQAIIQRKWPKLAALLAELDPVEDTDE